MKKVRLGKHWTRTTVSELCYGTGALSRYKDDHGLLIKAFKLGVNFWDTADCYGTENMVGKAAQKVGRENVIIQTKTDAYTKAEAKKTTNESLKELQTSYIDILLLHHIHTYEEWEKRQPAWNYLQELKDKGIVKYIGFSSHSSPEAVSKAPKEVDIILASIHENYIDNGTKQEMLTALEKQYKKGKGIIAMKILGAGKDVKSYKERIKEVRRYKFIHTCNIGMKTSSNLTRNVKLFQ